LLCLAEIPLDLQIRAVLALPVLVVLDEAYIEFSDVPSKLGWVARYPNLVVLRTFSKSAGAQWTCRVIGLAVRAWRAAGASCRIWEVSC
jgi:hypothetical protein